MRTQTVNEVVATTDHSLLLLLFVESDVRRAAAEVVPERQDSRQLARTRSAVTTTP